MLQGTQSFYFAFVVNMCRYVHYSAVRRREKINNNEASYCISGYYATEINRRAGVWNAAYPFRGDVNIWLSRQGRVKIESHAAGYLSALHLHHANTFTVGAYPGGSVTDSPFILFKTVFADHKSTGTTPAKFLFLFTAMANIRAYFSFSVTGFAFFYRHCCTSP